MGLSLTTPCDQEACAQQTTSRSTLVHILLLFTIVVAVYGLRLDDLTIRGEESRRATVAMEMIWTGDWIVPRQQGDPFFMSARPPLQSWVIGVFGLLRGQVDVIAVRLPSVLAILLTVLLIYRYGRSFMSGIGSFAAAAAFATMGQVMELGRLGETDAMFTLFVSASLLLWHWGFTCCWSAAITWSVAWLCVALATLTKGPQAVVYFVSGVGAFLFLTKQWRWALSWSHALGIMIAAVVVGLWQVPFFQVMGMKGITHIYTGDVRLYLSDWTLGDFVKHCATFPLKVFLSLTPWSALLLLLLRKDLRRSMGRYRNHLLFLGTCLAVAFPTVWLIPGANTRFFMSMYPCLAVILGVVVERMVLDVACRELWQKTVGGCAIGIVAFALFVIVASLLAIGMPVACQPPAIAAIVVASSLSLAIAAWWARISGDHQRALWGILSITSFTGLVYAGLVNNERISNGVNVAAQVAALKQQLPRDVALVSLGAIPHRFAFYFGAPIELHPRSDRDVQLPNGAFFCTTVQPNFPYVEIARINCDRSHSPQPKYVVIVGRRQSQNVRAD